MKSITLIQYAAVLMALTALSGCRKDLCYNHDDHALTVKAYFDTEWEQVWERNHGTDWQTNWNPSWNNTYLDFTPQAATGVRAITYLPDQNYQERNLPAEGGRVPMDEGTYDILFYNNDTEYIVFEDIPSSATASASTRTRTRGGFEDLHDGERTVSQPDMLYAAYLNGYKAEKTIEPVHRDITMHPLTYTYYIRYEFKSGLKYVALARGAIAGMAESVYLQDGHTGSEKATILYDAELKDYGVEARVKSFGVPDYPGDGYEPADETPVYSLQLEVRLTNGKIITKDFDITGQLANQPRGGVIIVKDIEISDDDGMEGGSGFDPDIDGWGDYIDIEVPIKNN